MIKQVAIGVLLSSTIMSAAVAEGFVAVGAGTASAKADCTGWNTCKDSGSGYKLSGGYMFTDRMGVEAVYFNMGKVTASGTRFYPGFGSSFTDTEIKTTGFGVGILGLLPLATEWSLSYRLGLLNAKSMIDVSTTNFGSASDSKSASNIYLGIGGGYNVNSNITVALEYDFFNATDVTDSKYTVSLTSLAARYRF